MGSDSVVRPYVKLVRSTETLELMKHPSAFMLLCQIALRAKRTSDVNFQGLEIGEALIGDHDSIGLTRQQYRTAIDKLKINQIITTTATRKGTIAKLINTSIFDINEDTKQPSKQPKNNQKSTTNNNTILNTNNIEGRKLKFASTLEPFLEKYGRDMLTKFYRYWVEPNKSGTKFKQENEKTWDLERRLETWADNDRVFNKQPKYSQLPNAIL